MDFIPSITFGNLVVAFSMISSVVVAAVTFKAKLDYLTLEFTRLANSLERVDTTLRLHDKYITILLTQAGIKTEGIEKR